MDDEGGPLSASEVELFRQLLQRYCEFELDQFEHFVVDTAYGDVFVGVTRKPPTDHPRQAYMRLPRLGTEQ
ncbi:MAG TPA: hypothetical protein VM677_04000 [Actinokineospora sp.]|nr:hypothetical protein [Actinokineospora sp.]